MLGRASGRCLASSRCAAPALRSGPSGDPTQRPDTSGIHGRKRASGRQSPDLREHVVPGSQPPYLVFGSRRHPQQAFRSCLGILRLAKSYGEARLEGAARRALAIGANSYRSVESILNHRLDEHPPEPIEPAAAIEHHNIRGSDYYS